MLGHALIVNQMYLLSSGKKTSTCLSSHLPCTLNTSARQCPSSGRLKTSSGTSRTSPLSSGRPDGCLRDDLAPGVDSGVCGASLSGGLQPAEGLHPTDLPFAPPADLLRSADGLHPVDRFSAPPADLLLCLCFSAIRPCVFGGSKGTRRPLPLPVAHDEKIGNPLARTLVVRSHQLAPAWPPFAAPILASLPPSRASVRSTGSSLPHVPAAHGMTSRIL